MSIVRHLRHLGYVIVGVGLWGSVVGVQGVSAAAYYVASTGNDTNPGTEAKPFRTVSQGVRPLKAGDTLYIKSGTYAEALDNNIPGGTSWSSPVTVAAYPGHTVTLRPPAGSRFVLRLLGPTKKYIVVDGLILDGINVAKDTVKLTYASAPPAAHHIRLKNSVIKNAHGEGIATDTTSEYNEFINLKVHDNGTTDFGHGMYIRSSNNLIEKCLVYRNAGWGLQLYRKGTTNVVNNNIIRNNKIYDNARVGDRGAGIVVSNGNGNLIYNNLIWGNKGGIQLNVGGVSETQIYNNTVYANRSYGIAIGAASTRASVRNNIVYNNSGPAISNGGSGTLLSENLLNVDPKFVNGAAKDFRLQAGSPAINSGATLSVVPNDYAGVSRPQSGRYDIGGYEYTGSTPSTLVTAPMHLRISDSR